MDLTVVGSVALDTVETPAGKNDEGLGGAATYFALAAANYAPVNLIGIVGEDFPEEYVRLLQDKGINLDGLERAAGKTFRWSGRYHEDINIRDTLDTQPPDIPDTRPPGTRPLGIPDTPGTRVLHRNPRAAALGPGPAPELLQSSTSSCHLLLIRFLLLMSFDVYLRVVSIGNLIESHLLFSLGDSSKGAGQLS